MENKNINGEDVIEGAEIMDISVIEAQDRAVIDMQIATAKRYPRNVQRAVSNSIAIVTMDADTAKTCHYALPRGGKSISGPSVHLAKIIAQNWGNMRIEAKVIGIDAKHVTSQAVCFDLENNLAIKVEVKRSIVGKAGKFNDDMITVTGNAANAIALRNAVFAVIPKGVVDKCYNSAKQMITGDVSSEAKLIARRKQVVDSLRDTYSITEKEILSAINRQSINHISADDIITLIGIGQAIKDGETTIEMAFKNSRNSKTSKEAEGERVQLIIKDCKTLVELVKLKETLPKEFSDLYELKFHELQEKEGKK